MTETIKQTPHAHEHHLIGTGLVASERQVPHEERSLGAARHGAAVDKHLVDRDRERGVVAVDHHGGGVAHETDVDGGGVKVDGGGVIVGGDHGDGLRRSVLLSQVPERDSLVGVLRRGTRIDGVLGNVAEAPKKSRHRGTRSVSRSQERRHCAVQSEGN